MMRRDQELGDALRAALTRPDDDLFVRRVLHQADELGTWWEILGRWARPGLAAALLLAAASGFWLGRQMPADLADAFDEPTATGTAGQVAQVLDTYRPPNIDVMLAVVNGQE